MSPDKSLCLLGFFLVLTHFQPIYHFYIPWNQRFSDVFRGYRSGILARNRLVVNNIKHYYLRSEVEVEFTNLKIDKVNRINETLILLKK